MTKTLHADRPKRKPFVGITSPVTARGRKNTAYSHGLSCVPEYRAWQTMRLRCTNPSNRAFPDYGARGVYVCARWMESPAHFIADLGSKPSPRHEVDRINNDGSYTCGKCDDCVARGAPANVRWTTRKVNCRNRRSNRIVEYRGEALPLAAWCERTGIPSDTAMKRLNAGWTAAATFETPLRKYRDRPTREVLRCL